MSSTYKPPSEAIQIPRTDSALPPGVEITRAEGDGSIWLRAPYHRRLSTWCKRHHGTWSPLAKEWRFDVGGLPASHPRSVDSQIADACCRYLLEEEICGMCSRPGELTAYARKHIVGMLCGPCVERADAALDDLEGRI